MKLYTACIQLLSLFYISTANRHSPKAFDEFLLKALEEGQIPDMDDLTVVSPEISFDEFLDQASQSLTTQQSSEEEVTTSRPVRPSVRSRSRSRSRSRLPPSPRQNDNELEQILSSMIGREINIESSEEPEESIYTRAQRIHNSRAPQQRRRHSRRDLDMDQMERDLAGVPQAEWSCCTLGALAGDKGFLCTASYYERRSWNRNANRVHNRRMGAYFQNQQPTNAGRSLMGKFERCVTNTSGARQFETCCDDMNRQNTERTERWRAFRHAIANVNVEKR